MEEKRVNRLRHLFHTLLVAVLLAHAAPGPSLAVEAGALPLRPGETLAQPRQRRLNEIDAIPQNETTCPVCGYSVLIPAVDTLMRKHPTTGQTPSWRMAWRGRDADLCPYPPPGAIAYQADIALCPSCGFANRSAVFSKPVPTEAVGWVMANLQPEIRAVEYALVGDRAETLTEAERIDFFNQQELLPDTVRTEHYRTYLMAVHAPALERAEACLLAAWASRRDMAADPKGAFLSRGAQTVRAALEKTKRDRPGVQGDADALRQLLARMRRAKREEPPDGEHLAGRVVLAGMDARLGLLSDAETLLQEVYHELRERYLRHEQDPLWSMTTPRAPVAQRLTELERMRAEGERELLSRMDMPRREREQLSAAAECIRDAIRYGDLHGKHAETLFWTYMMGECLRRSGDLPLASEWFTILLSLAEKGSDLARAAAMQLEYVGERAGDTVNLLSALGRDGDLFAILRSICGAAHTDVPMPRPADQTPALEAIPPVRPAMPSGGRP